MDRGRMDLCILVNSSKILGNTKRRHRSSIKLATATDGQLPYRTRTASLAIVPLSVFSSSPRQTPAAVVVLKDKVDQTTLSAWKWLWGGARHRKSYSYAICLCQLTYVHHILQRLHLNHQNRVRLFRILYSCCFLFNGNPLDLRRFAT